MKLSKEQLKGSIRLTRKNVWENRFPLYGQLNYRKECELGIACTFTTIVWLHGDYHAHIMSPYLCYSGNDPITYTKLSKVDTVKILWIGVKTYIRDFVYHILPKIFKSIFFNFKSIFFNFKNKLKNMYTKKQSDVFDFLEY